MKINDALKKMLESIPRQVIDQDSVTTDEISAELDCGRTKAIQLVRKKLKSGEWERVMKRLVGYDKPVPSYRLKKKPRK